MKKKTSAGQKKRSHFVEQFKNPRTASRTSGTPRRFFRNSGTFLSIAMIFKNEIRCLERCLQSLQPLRDAIPCELVMADTGSTDGSREIAARYADILIDFEWINDFSAARNAVLQHCSGNFFLCIDADEWIDPDVEQFVKFLKRPDPTVATGFVIQRNYAFADNMKQYSDIIVPRVYNMSGQPEYHDPIHENVYFRKDIPSSHSHVFDRLILHHDGYAGLYTTEEGKIKRERNVKLLREHLQENPDNMRTILEFLEAGREEPDYETHLLHGLELAETKANGWDTWGRVITRLAAEFYFDKDPENFTRWTDFARERFPNSLYTTLDIGYLLFVTAINKKEHEQAIRYGEEFFSAWDKSHITRESVTDRMLSSLRRDSVDARQWAEMYFAAENVFVKNPERAVETVKSMDFAELSTEQATILFTILRLMASAAPAETLPLARSYWDSVRGQDAEWLTKLLDKKDFLPRIPPDVFADVLENGADFPSPSTDMRVMNALAQRLETRPKRLITLALDSSTADFTADPDSLYWVHRLILSAVRVFNWKQSAMYGQENSGTSPVSSESVEDAPEITPETLAEEIPENSVPDSPSEDTGKNESVIPGADLNMTPHINLSDAADGSPEISPDGAADSSADAAQTINSSADAAQNVSPDSAEDVVQNAAKDDSTDTADDDDDITTDPQTGLILARAFAFVLREYLLRDTNLQTMDSPPPFYAFALCVDRAFLAAEQSNPMECVRALREAVQRDPSLKVIALFLLNQMPELK